MVREIDAGIGIEADEQRLSRAAPPTDLAPPAGELLLVSIDGSPVAIGGVRDLDADIAELKSMYVARSGRGRGVGRRLLGCLEAIAAEHGCRAVRLDTALHLTVAVELYRKAGYREVPRYNDNPKAALWFERDLG